MRTLRALSPLVVAGLTAASLCISCSWDYLIWIQHSPEADPLYRFVKGDKAGYIDQTGKIVIPPSLEYFGGNHAGEFHSGLLEIAASDGVYVDTTGKKVIDKGFYRGWDFSDGLAVAMRKDGEKWGYIDKTGEFAISPRFESSNANYVWPFQEGFAKIKVAGKIGYIDHSGEFKIPPQLLTGESFHNGFARVVVEGPCVDWSSEYACSSPTTVPGGTPEQTSYPSCKYTFIDRTGHIITESRYDEERDFSEELAPVRVGQYWGYIDTKGNLAILPRFDSASSFADGVAMVSEHELRGYIDHSGVYVIRPQWKYAEDFSEGFAVVNTDDEDYIYIDHSGRQAFPEVYNHASSFFKGLAHVEYSRALVDVGWFEKGFAYIDHTGKRVFTYHK